ncbi:MAG TPA: 6-phosphogluconolactonase [Ktedonobacterales bacterium]|jgi:6-phosphogluconolactonase|nr:6-phosphogluconolactonase [Ktedonobacterales bacterium]
MTENTAQDRRHLEVFADQDQLAQAAAELFVRLSREHPEREHFTVALSGGSTPRKYHALLAAPPQVEQVDWSKVEFYWGDERFVPPDHPDSNYRMARETLLQALPLRSDQVHPMPTEIGDAAAAAAAYEADIRRGFTLLPGEWPRFDLILLGMGPDGHTASLFPHTAALHVRDRLVVANEVPQLQTTRITLTVPVLNDAAHVAFVVGGTDKADAVATVLEGARQPEEYPSQLVWPSDGDVYWLLDDAAAAKLQRRS